MAEYPLPVDGVKNGRFSPEGQPAPRYFPKNRSKIVIDSEAKADEVFGKQTIGEALAVGWKKNEAYARGEARKASCLPARVQTLSQAVFGREVE